MSNLVFRNHLESSGSLVTPHEQTRAGFITLALEKNKMATPYVDEARVLKALVSKVDKPIQLLKISDIRSSIMTAAGISDKAEHHLTEDDKAQAIKGLIKNFLEPAGDNFIDELIYRFLLTKGDSLGGRMRNLAGALGERKFKRTVIATLKVKGRKYSWLDSKSKKWFASGNGDADIDKIRGLHWNNGKNKRTLIYNLTVPIIKKNVDLCLFNASHKQFIPSNKKSCHCKPNLYIALGELKGGIDPAGADEHWKTANSALDRIRKAFYKKGVKPKTFFIGAAIEKAMAREIYLQLGSRKMTNAANLTDDNQLVSICKWLIDL